MYNKENPYTHKKEMDNRNADIYTGNSNSLRKEIQSSLNCD